ncbi:DUF6210 family protein [Streptomyces sp. NPDC019531]
MAAPSGVVHEAQGGGHGCVRHEQEGCLLPVPGRALDGPGVLTWENFD